MEGNDKSLKKKITIKNIGIDKLLLLALAGVVLVLLSVPFSGKSSSEKDKVATQTTQAANEENDTSYASALEQKLEDVLSKVEGVGKVEVMVTMKDSGEKIVDSETPYTKNDTTESDSAGGSRTVTEVEQSDTTIYTVDENGNNIPFVINELAPQIEGVAVIAEGGGNAVMVNKITNVIEALLNVSANKISVMKMKS